MLPVGTFTIEAFVLLRSVYDDGTVRTIAAHWSGDKKKPGWSFGVTSQKSAYKPHALVLQFFGDYVGTAKKPGLAWANPLFTKKRISLRVRNFESSRLKVNDHEGNPIEIASVVVWRVVDTAEAVFEVDDYQNFVKVQSEAAVRNLATRYKYDAHEEHEISLRGNTAEVAEHLKKEIQERLARAAEYRARHEARRWSRPSGAGGSSTRPKMMAGERRSVTATFERFCACLNHLEVDYVIVGSEAVAFHGVPRYMIEEALELIAAGWLCIALFARARVAGVRSLPSQPPR